MSMDSLVPARSPIGGKLVPIGLAFKMLFEICYVYHISPSFSYMGLVLALDYQKLTESYLITLAMLLLMSARARTPSAIILTIGLFMGVMPILSIYALQGRAASFTYVSVSAFVIGFIISGLPRVRVSYVKTSENFFLGLCVAFVSIVIVFSVAQGAYRHFTFDLNSIYVYRSELNELVFVGAFKYITPWTFNAFNVILLLWSLHYRRRMLLFCAISAQIFIYACTLEKAVLFNFLLIALVYYVVRRSGNVIGLSVLFCIGVLAGMLETVLFAQANLTELVTRRVLALPSYLANEYFELFGDIGHVYWTNGLLGGMAPYPFADDPPKLVGKAAMGSLETWANNGMFGMGFMQAGFIGILLYGVVYGLWLYLIDCIAVGRVPVEVAVSAVIIPTVLAVTDSDLPTSLLTHGGIVATLMLWLWGGVLAEREAARVRGGRRMTCEDTAGGTLTLQQRTWRGGG
jgi:hypothetical protein